VSPVYRKAISGKLISGAPVACGNAILLTGSRPSREGETVDSIEKCFATPGKTCGATCGFLEGLRKSYPR
jgi:hypothetical protein